MVVTKRHAQFVIAKNDHFPELWWDPTLNQLECHAKIGPPKIGLAGPILAEKFAKISPLELATFAAKISPVEPILAAKTGPPLPLLVPYKM